MKKAVILCSGGPDSIITAYYAKKKGYLVEILFFNYGQRNLIAERKSVTNFSKDLNAKVTELQINMKKTGQLMTKGAYKKISKEDLRDTRSESMNWYVPCRNLIFISQALAYVEGTYDKEGSKDIFVGFIDNGMESFPDTSEEFVYKMNELSKILCKSHFKIVAPFIRKNKEDVFLEGKKMGIKLGKTFSCYSSKTKHCGKCLACQLRKQAFYWSGLEDETEYLE